MKKYLFATFLIACASTPKNGSTTGGTGGATGTATASTGGTSTGSSTGGATAALTINNTEFWCNVIATVSGTQVASFGTDSDATTIDVAVGATVDLTASPEASFEPAVWTGTTTTAGPHATYIMTAAAGQAVTADCALAGTTVPSHNLTLLSPDNTDCPVTATALRAASGAALNPTLSFQEGTVVVLSVAPITGATFNGFTGTDAGYPNEVTIGSTDTSVTLSCTPPSAPPPTYTLSITQPANGTITPSPDQATYAAGTVVTLTLAPTCGYAPTSWTNTTAGSPTALTNTVTMNSDVTGVTATLAQPATFNLTVNAPPDTFIFGTVSDGTHTYNNTTHVYPYAPLTDVTLTVTETACTTWPFESWSGTTESSTACSNTITICGDSTVDATFTLPTAGTPACASLGSPRCHG